jgi:hypothetical protein
VWVLATVLAPEGGSVGVFCSKDIVGGVTAGLVQAVKMIVMTAKKLQAAARWEVLPIQDASIILLD